MKKKLLLLSLVVISCVCVAFGLTGCKHSHTLVKTDEIAATCTTDGQEAYWTCSDSSCGKMFSDAEGTTEITAPIVIPATGHSYAATFEWTAATEGGYTAAATLTCSACNDTQTVTATVTSETTAATCTADGSIVYTATAAYDGETYTDTKTVTLAAAHSYSEDWSSDGTSHWHACTACDATTNVAEHTFVEDEDGNYVCSVCGKTVYSYITGSDTLALGDNYVYLASSSSHIYADITYTVPADSDGLYTFTISEDCQVWVAIEDANGDRYTIGTTGSTDDVYSVSIAAVAGDVLNMYCVYAIDDTDFTNYVFNVNISYKAAAIGSEDLPYTLSGSSELTIAAGEKYYFKVSGYSSLYQVYVANSGLDLYQNGTKLTLTKDSNDNYCYYFYGTYGTTYTFCLANDTSASITDTVYCSSYSVANLAEGTNTLTITSAMLDSNGCISYKLTVPAATAYTMTLGTDTDSSVAIKSSSSSSATLYLGYGSEATSYIFGNSKTSSSSTQTFYIQYTGEATSFTVVLIFTEYEETIDDKDSEATYTALTLDTAVTCTPVVCTHYTVSTYNKIYLSYTTQEAGDYTLTLSALYYGTYDYTSTVGTYFTYYLNGVEVSSGSSCNLSLIAGENKIIVKAAITSLSNYTISYTLSKTSSSSDTPSSSGDYTLTSSGLTLSLTAGTYTVAIDSSAYVNDLYDQWAEAYYTQYDLEISDYDSSLSGTYTDIVDIETTNDSALLYVQGETSYIKVYSSDTSITITVYYACTLTITCASATTDTSSVPTTLSTGDNEVYITASDSTGDGVSSTFTVTEAGNYVFTISADEDGYVKINNGYTLSASGTLTYTIELSANVAYTITFWTDSMAAATYTLNIALEGSEGGDSGSGSSATLSLTGSNSVSATLDETTELTGYLYNNAAWAESSYYDASCAIYTLTVSADDEGWYTAAVEAAASNDNSSTICITICESYSSLEAIKSAARYDVAYAYGELYLYAIATFDCNSSSDYFELYEGTYYILVYETYGDYDVSGTLTFTADAS